MGLTLKESNDVFLCLDREYVKIVHNCINIALSVLSVSNIAGNYFLETLLVSRQSVYHYILH